MVYIQVQDPYGQSGVFTISLSFYGQHTSYTNGSGFWSGDQGLVGRVDNHANQIMAEAKCRKARKLRAVFS